MREELELQDNPAFANWEKMEEKRASFSTKNGDHVSPRVEFARVQVTKKPDPKTGKLKITFSGGPYIQLFAPDGSPFQYVTAEGKRVPFSKSSIFTFTSKMSCPSFSIPAGPTTGGTCPASKPHSIEAEGSYLEYSPSISKIPHGESFICDLCYAGKNNYLMYPNISAGQMAKKAWVMETMRAGTFVEEMSKSIEMLFDPRIEKVFMANAISNRFFRIHDSGDFFTKDYYRAWVEVCKNFKGQLNPDGGPLIYFWAPTRMWVYRDYLDLFRSVPPPPNLALRPSALFTGAPTPRIPGLAAGSTSTAGEVDPSWWNCPAYESETATCAGTRCRKCWTLKKTPVNYHTH
jgi:Gene product 88